ncbi:uncharacterized protein LOC143538802 isoform X2 [Bidens hawaiensis]|uniref:uncharacterized protein LOC143538802 isoform X2 n=1 Tax=Bidens hawaiensis TaxID=980011 RepID=UPI00404A939A
MFVKLQPLDTNCIPIIHPLNTQKPTTVNSIPLARHRTQKETEHQLIKKHQIHPPNPSDFEQSVVFYTPKPNPDGSVETQVNKRLWSRKENLHTKCSTKVLNENAVVKTVHTGCLMKWVRYGGCIPAMLEALDRISDLDEAFKPWELTLSKKEMTIVLKEQEVWERAREIFEWFKRKGCYEVNVIHYNVMIRALGKARRWVELEMLMDEMEDNGIEYVNSTFGTLIDVYSKGGVREKAMYWLDVMNKKGLEPDEVTMGIVVQMFKTAGQFEKAEGFYKNWLACRNLCLSVHTYNTMIDNYGKAGRLKDASDTFDKMLRKGNMSSECYSANIDAFGERGHVLEAEKVFKCCQERRNPTVLEFNVMIKAYSINKQYDEACRLVDIMDEYGVDPDKCSYNSLIQMLATADLPQKATFYLRKMQESGLVSDCISYCAVISSFVKLGQLETGVSLFEEMIGFNVEPDVVAYGVLINAYADIGNVERALHYVNEMKQTGLAVNGVICNSLIKLYTKVGFLKDAEEAYYMLQRLNVGPDVYCSNCMIDLYTEQSMLKPAEEIFEKLKRNGIANEFSYAMMLCMYKKIGSFDEAFEIAKEMRELGLMTDLLSYNHVLGLYALDGRFKEAVMIFKEMIESGVEPTESTFKSLGVVLMKHGVSKKAVKNLEIMWRDDCQSGLEVWMATLDSVSGMVYHDISDR